MSAFSGAPVAAMPQAPRGRRGDGPPLVPSGVRLVHRSLGSREKSEASSRDSQNENRPGIDHEEWGAVHLTGPFFLNPNPKQDNAVYRDAPGVALFFPGVEQKTRRPGARGFVLESICRDGVRHARVRGRTRGTRRTLSCVV